MTHIDSDVKWLGIGIFEVASKDWEEVPGVKALFEGVAGWNTHLDEVGLTGWPGRQGERCASSKRSRSAPTPITP
ncbi:MAG: hypothetical protein WKF43_17830 [Acidimicrobiales bacterium]